VFKKIGFNIFSIVKKVYLSTFNFMIGKQHRTILRLYVHMMALLLWLVFPYAYFSGVICPLVTGIVEVNAESVFFAFIIVFVPLVVACLVKFQMAFLLKKWMQT